jgi:hypothetical protein
MKVVVLYRPNSEHGRLVETFIQDFRHQHNAGRLEVLDIDSRDGAATAMLYDIMQFPTILALANDGSVTKSWEGEMLPLMDELAYYTMSGGDSFAAEPKSEL